MAFAIRRAPNSTREYWYFRAPTTALASSRVSVPPTWPSDGDPLSDRQIYEQFKFSEMGSPLTGRFVFPDIRPGSDMAKLPFDEVVAFLLQNLTHVHTIPGDGLVASRLSGIRPGQLVHLRGVLVDTVAPSRALYRTSLQLFDYDCEIMWVDSITLE